MEVRNTVHPEDFKHYTTERIKKEFLVQNLFVKNEIKLVYTHFDRMIVGGICPHKPHKLEANKELGSNFFLERREMGIINVGPKGNVPDVRTCGRGANSVSVAVKVFDYFVRTENGSHNEGRAEGGKR